MASNIITEINRRFNIMISNIDLSVPKIAFGRSGSFICFCSGLSLLGSNGDIPWMDKQYRERLLTVEQYSSNEYGDLLYSLHNKLLGMMK